NNLANVNTTGFKSTLLQVEAARPFELYRIQTDPGKTQGSPLPGAHVAQYVGALGTGSLVMDTPTEFAEGAFAQTGNTLDMALAGNGFFTIQTPQGVRYTRDGGFVRNAQGLLSTQSGDLVLGNGGAIAVPATGKLEIGSDGTISSNGQVIDQLRLTQFANQVALRPEGDNRFVDTGAARPSAAATTTVNQGFLEKSNANVVRSMVDLINAQRWFQANEKAMQAQDDLTNSVIQNVGHSSH
ncbi:MAG: flagellar hook-basal body protein, partial [Candidatus Eremiobacteraeota bacterium]|nr:flagellar hook-basal body protein [Candidatus Eremiobacteraeota bacterium]